MLVKLLAIFGGIALAAWLATGDVSTLDALAIALAAFTVGWLARGLYD